MKGRLIGRGRTAELYAWDDHRALKLFDSGWPAATAEAEARVARQVFESGIRAPAVYEVVEVDHRHGIIYERVDGRAMLDVLSGRPWLVAHFAGLLADLQAEMHARRAPDLPAQRDRMIGLIHSATTLDQRRRKAALEILDNLPDGDAVCHGDYHPGNVLLAADGPVIIDWPLAARGNPHADVARTSLLLSLGEVPEGTPGRRLMETGRALFHHLYLRRYMHRRRISPGDVEAWRIPVTAARLGEGIPEETDRLLAQISANPSG